FQDSGGGKAANSPAWKEAARSGSKATTHNKDGSNTNRTVPCKWRTGGATTEEV
ncbi:hypothetical protein A2U01_0087628, partial [Trifolium medium]|nr:hypothetical protein [Trifolium medium]